MNKKNKGFGFLHYIFFAVAILLTMLLCVCAGSVNISVSDTLTAIWNTIAGIPIPKGIAGSIIISVRLPRVICVALTGAALSIAGAAMQGLLRNPLADGSTLGVSSGASLGAVLSLAFGITIPGLPYAGTMVMAMIFAFLSLALIISLAYFLDHSLSTNSIILIGVIFSMFISAIINLIVSFSGEKVKSITFWMMGSLSGSNFTHVLILLVALIVCGGIILFFAEELNAFAIGEDNARNIGVNVKLIKILIMIIVSVLIGICVSVGGTIGFVGLVMPHMTRMAVGPNHKRLLPASICSGAIFLMLADLVARIIIRPVELSIGVVTSLIGAVVFVFIFYRSRKGN